MRTLAVAGLAFVLASCAGSGAPRTPIERLERALVGTAQPSEVVSAESAFARTAREDGQWTAFREFAAPGAVLHLPSGPVDAAGWLQGREDPAEAVKWSPRAIWMSCTGELAVSTGAYVQPDGIIGRYATAWKLKRDRTYEWLYDVGQHDDPQPVPQAEADIPDDAIVVTALDAIQGNVADCQDRENPIPPPAVPIPDEEVKFRSSLSKDGTLFWTYRHDPDGTRMMTVDWFKDGGWQRAFTFPEP